MSIIWCRYVPHFSKTLKESQLFQRSLEGLKCFIEAPKVYNHSTTLRNRRQMREIDIKMPSKFVREIEREVLKVRTNIPAVNEHVIAFIMRGLPALSLKTGCGYSVSTKEDKICLYVHSIEKERAENALGPVREWLETTIKTGVQVHSFKRKLVIPFERNSPSFIMIQALVADGHYKIRAIEDKTNTRISFSARGVKPKQMTVYAHSEHEVEEGYKLLYQLVMQTFKHLRSYSKGKLLVPENLPKDFDIFSFLEQIPLVLDKKYGDNKPIVSLCWNQDRTSEEEIYAYYDIRSKCQHSVEDVKGLLIQLIQQEVEQYHRQAHEMVVFPPSSTYVKFSNVMNTSGLSLLRSWIEKDDSLKNIRLHFKGDEERKLEFKFQKTHSKIHVRGDSEADVQKVVQEINRLITNYTDVFMH
uniref:Uncharacterized protein n=1 Tax=Magallana gigas TaxID=29159 RepID=A0A8W8M105_MAGGI|nr:uncharacterized protein LOC105325961 [Crassostrea gigas]